MQSKEIKDVKKLNSDQNLWDVIEDSLKAVLQDSDKVFYIIYRNGDVRSIYGSEPDIAEDETLIAKIDKFSLQQAREYFNDINFSFCFKSWFKSANLDDFVSKENIKNLSNIELVSYIQNNYPELYEIVQLAWEKEMNEQYTEYALRDDIIKIVEKCLHTLNIY